MVNPTQKPLHYQIDSHSGVPAYRQIMDQTKYYVASGALQPGDQLASIRDLARRLCVNPTTIVKAYTELEHEAVIEMLHGKGVFVASGAPLRLSEREQARALRRLARQLAVEAAQMRARRELVWEVVRAEIDAVNGDNSGARLLAAVAAGRKTAHG